MQRRHSKNRQKIQKILAFCQNSCYISYSSLYHTKNYAGYYDILLHIAQRRGFRSNRKSGTSKEDGELLAAVTANRALMSEKGYRTVGEMLLKDPQYSTNKRNKGANTLQR